MIEIHKSIKFHSKVGLCLTSTLKGSLKRAPGALEGSTADTLPAPGHAESEEYQTKMIDTVKHMMSFEVATGAELLDGYRQWPPESTLLASLLALKRLLDSTACLEVDLPMELVADARNGTGRIFPHSRGAIEFLRLPEQYEPHH